MIWKLLWTPKWKKYRMDVKIGNISLIWSQNYKILNSCRIVLYFHFMPCYAFVTCLDFVTLHIVPCRFFIKSDTVRLKYRSKTVPYRARQSYHATLKPYYSAPYSATYEFRTLLTSERYEDILNLSPQLLGRENTVRERIFDRWDRRGFQREWARGVLWQCCLDTPTKRVWVWIAGAKWFE
jgi:hypothetical protein